MREIDRKVQTVIKEMGGTVLELGNTKRHRFVRWRLGAQERKAIYSRGCAKLGRGFENTVAMIRRMCKEMQS